MSLVAPKWTPLVLLASLMTLAYARVVTCGYIWDDDDYVTHNPVLRTLGGLYDIWFTPTSLPQYYPLVHTTFWLEYRLWGLAPLGYHLVNVLLHGASAIVLLRIGRRLAIPGMLFASLLVAVHPVHVESVAWVTERKNVLSLLCYLLAAERWLRWHDGDGPAARNYLIGSLWFVGALWSKTVTASLPAALLVVVWWRDGRLTRRAVQAALPWLLVGAGLGYFTVHLEATHVGAAGESWQLAGAERLLVAGRACWFYLVSLLWPFETCFNYPRWQVDTEVWWQWLYPAGALAAVVVAFLLRARIGRGLCAALLIFGGTLFPAIGFFDVYPFRYSFVADHFQYHASVAIVVAAASFAVVRSERLKREVQLGIGAVFLVVMALTTMSEVGQYRDAETLWRATLEKNPRSAIAHANLGAIETDAYGAARAAGRVGDAAAHLAEAREHLEAVLEIDGGSHEARLNLGVLAHQQGDRGRARELYEEALAIRPSQPNVWSNLAMLEAEEGQRDAALSKVEKALALDPEHVNAHIVRGQVLFELGLFREAVPELEWVLRRMRRAPDVRRRYVLSLDALRNDEPCIAQAAQILRSGSDEPKVLAALSRSLARLVRQQPEGQAGAVVRSILQQSQLDVVAIVPLVVRELREMGDRVRAAAVAGQ